MDWNQVSALAAVVGLVISVVALVVAAIGTQSSNKLAAEALETSRQANSIALGLVREPAILEFAFSRSEHFFFDFSNPEVLQHELKKYVTLQNVGKQLIDSIVFECIGITGLTTQLSDPTHKFPVLPSVTERLDLRSALQPNGLMHVDMRRYLLLYLAKLVPNLTDMTATYDTVVNVVLAPKAINESTPAGVATGLTKDDRRLLKIRFTPGLLESPEARAVLADKSVPHRLYD
jgi:hypothetical protein